MTRLNDKVAVVTGGANGLGAAIATRLVQEGAAVAILDRDPAGRQVAEKIAADGGLAVFRACDVTREEQVEAAFRGVVAELGRLDILVNNAGIEGVNRPTDQLDLAEWERVMAVNCTAVFLCTKHAISHLRRAGRGSIVNISSIYGLVGGGDIPPPLGRNRYTGRHCLGRGVPGLRRGALGDRQRTRHRRGYPAR